MKECSTKTFAELADPDSSSETSPMKGDRARKADISLHKSMVTLINGTQEFIKHDLVREERNAFENDTTLGGRQVVWMLLNYFKTNKSLQQQYTYEDIKAIQWKGDDHIFETYSRWSSVMSSIGHKFDDDTKIETFLAIFRPSKKLAPDIHEFDRF